MSGRFRTEYLTRHWSQNKQGFCLANTCSNTIGDLEHMLIHCKALSEVRGKMWDLMFEKAVEFPPLFLFFQYLEKCLPNIQMQFLLNPTALDEIREILKICGQPALELISYLTRTFTYYLYRKKQILTGWWVSDNPIAKKNKKRRKLMNVKNSVTNIAFSGTGDGYGAPDTDCAGQKQSYPVVYVPGYNRAKQPPNHPVLVPQQLLTTLAHPVSSLSDTKQCHTTDRLAGLAGPCSITIETRLDLDAVIGGIPRHVSDSDHDRSQRVCGGSSAGVCGFAGDRVWDVTRQFHYVFVGR